MKNCKNLKEGQSKSVALKEEQFRKKMKRITGEIDMFDAFVSSLDQLVRKIA